MKEHQKKLLLTEEKITEIKSKNQNFFIYSNCHSPTANSLSSIERHNLIKLAKEINALIIEMDIYSTLNYDDFTLPNLSTIDGLNNTFYVASYSKFWLQE